MNRLGFGLSLTRALMLAGTIISSPATIPQGRQSGYSSGIAYDIIADASRGNDVTGDGSLATPYKTLIKALDVAIASGGTKKKIGLRGDLGQIYDIPPAISTDGIGLHGYQDELAILEGSYTVTGFVACDAGDVDVLGAKWPSCYKATFAKSNLSHTAYNALLPVENGTILNLAQLRRDVSDLFVQSDPTTFYASAKGDDVTITQSGSDISTISHPSVLATFTDTQLENMAVMVHVDANKCAYLEVASALSGVITLTTPNGFTKSAINGDCYSLLNAGPAIEPGEYVWKDNGDDTLSLYVNPNNAANLAAGIKVAARDNALTFSNSANNEASNLHIRYISNDGSSLNQGPIVLDHTTGARIVQNVVEYLGYKHFAAVNGPGTGPVVVVEGQNNTVQYNDMKHGQNQFGPFFTTNSTVTFNASGNSLLNNYIYRMTVSPWRMYGETLGLVADNLFADCGVDAHSGKGEMTQGCDQSVIWRNTWVGCQGYISVQKLSRILIGVNNCPSPENRNDARAIVDQSNDAVGAGRVNPSTNYCILNLSGKPDSNTGTQAAIVLTASSSDTANWYAFGNVSHGLDTATAPAKLLGSGDGVYTKAPTITRASDTIVAADDVFYDIANRNWNTLPGSILTTKIGATDLTSIFELYEGWFPGFDFRRGLDNLPIDPAAARPGPYGGPWPVQADTTAPVVAFVGEPVIAGASASITVTTNERGGRIYWERYNGGAVPTGAQVVEAQTAAGGTPLSSGSIAVGDPGQQPPFTVTGTSGEEDQLAIAHQDRYGNISAVQTTTLSFAAFSPTWVAFDGVHFLRRAAALTGAQASTRKMIAAITLSRSAAQLTAGLNNGLFGANGSSVAVPTWGTTSTGKLQLIQEQAADTAFANLVVPSVGMTAAVQYLLLVCFTADGAHATMNATLWNIATGAQAGLTATTGSIAGDISLKFLNPYDIFKAALTAERFMLWDNPDLATPDATDATLRGLFMADGALLDPAVAASALGTPLIDPDLATGANRGSGGNFTMT